MPTVPRVRRHATAGDVAVIPRVFHFIWLEGSPALPHLFQTFMDGWADKHPEWEVRLWDRPEWPLRNQDLYDRASELCPGFEGQLRSDVWRLELLLEHGGVYLDVDFECLKCIER